MTSLIKKKTSAVEVTGRWLPVSMPNTTSNEHDHHADHTGDVLCTVFILCAVVSMFVPIKCGDKTMPLACAPFALVNLIFLLISFGVLESCNHVYSRVLECCDHVHSCVCGLASNLLRWLARPQHALPVLGAVYEIEHTQVEFYDSTGALRAIAWPELAVQTTSTSARTR